VLALVLHFNFKMKHIPFKPILILIFGPLMAFHAWADDQTQPPIDLPNGAFSSPSWRDLYIVKNVLTLRNLDGDSVEATLTRGTGPTSKGETLFKDDGKKALQVVVGNCKHLDKPTCFFEVTHILGTNEKQQIMKADVFDILITSENDGAFLNVDFTERHEVNGQKPQIKARWIEPFHRKIPQFSR
jgi:hypothetical protein